MYKKGDLQALLRNETEDTTWVEHPLALRREEWASLHRLGMLWFGARVPLKFVIARLMDEFRICFTPPPMEERAKERIEVREEDWETLKHLGRSLGMDIPSNVLRGLIHMTSVAPDYLFVNPHDLLGIDWEIEDGDDWANVRHLRRILNKVLQRNGKPGRIKSSVKDEAALCWGTVTTPKSRKRLGERAMRYLADYGTANEESHEVCLDTPFK